MRCLHVYCIIVNLNNFSAFLFVQVNIFYRYIGIKLTSQDQIAQIFFGKRQLEFLTIFIENGILGRWVVKNLKLFLFLV